jgi:hypothetical protein
MIGIGSHRKYRIAALAMIFALSPLRPACAQTASNQSAKRVFTLEQAVDFALKNYPAVRASLERVVRIRDGNAEWVNGHTGEMDGKLLAKSPAK